MNTNISSAKGSKKERKMTEKGWLKKANSPVAKASMDGFLSAYRDFLENGELKVITSPILQKFDSAEVKAEEAVEQLQNIIFTHMVYTAANKTTHSNKSERSYGNKAHTATVFDINGNVPLVKNANGKEVELKQDFDLPQEAERWLDRRLYEGQSDWHGTVVHNKMNGSQCVVRRTESIERLLKQPKGSVLKYKPQSTGKLAFGGKAKQDHCHFSKG